MAFTILELFAEIKYLPIEATALGDNVAIPPVANKRIRVLGYGLKNVLAVLIELKDNGGGTRAKFDLGAGDRAYYAGSIFGPAFETAVGKGVDINLGLATPVRGHMTYQEI